MLSIDPYEVKQNMDIFTYEVEWDEYPLQEYPVSRPRFDCVGIFTHMTGKDFIRNVAMEDH